MMLPLRTSLLAAILSLVPPVHAQGVVADRSEIRFLVKQLGVAVEGRFRRWKANVVFLPDAPAKSKAEFEIDLASIDLASDDSEAEVRGAHWFDAARHPTARFVSTSVRNVGADRYEITGPLTLKGITRDIVVPVTVRREAAGTRVAEGGFVLRRLDFKLGEGQWADPDMVANDVSVRVRIVLASAG